MPPPATNTYAVINIADVSNVDFSEVHETNAGTVFRSVDFLFFILKWDTEPTFITSGLVVPVQVLTYAQAGALMRTPEWDATLPL